MLRALTIRGRAPDERWAASAGPAGAPPSRAGADGRGAELLPRLVRIAAESEACRPLLEVAWRALRRSLTVLDPTGAVVAAVPGGRSARPRSVARGAASGVGRPSAARRRATARLPDRGPERDGRRRCLGGARAADRAAGRPARSQRPAPDGARRAPCRLPPPDRDRRRVRSGPSARRGPRALGGRRRQLLAGAARPRVAATASNSADLARAWQQATPEGSFAVPVDGSLVLLYATDPANVVSRAAVERGAGWSWPGRAARPRGHGS